MIDVRNGKITKILRSYQNEAVNDLIEIVKNDTWLLICAIDSQLPGGPYIHVFDLNV